MWVYLGIAVLTDCGRGSRGVLGEEVEGRLRRLILVLVVQLEIWVSPTWANWQVTMVPIAPISISKCSNNCHSSAHSDSTTRTMLP